MLKKCGLAASLIIIFSLILMPVSFAQVDDPAADLPSQEDVVSEVYTAEEFSALSDDEKRDVYLNSSQMLPVGFDPVTYMNILHPLEEEAE